MDSEQLRNEIFKKYKKDALQPLSLLSTASGVKGYISSGIAAVDYVFGKPGIPVGRLTEISGWESSGKSSLAAQLVGSCQQVGGIAVVVDSEHSYSEEGWAERFGIDTEALNILDPEHVQEALSMMEFIIDKTGEMADANSRPILMVWDSVAGTPTEQDLSDDDYSGKWIGVHARLISKALRRWQKKMHDRNIALLFINQLRTRPEMAFTSFHAPSSNKTGPAKIAEHAIGFHAAVQMSLTRKSFIRTGEEKDAAVIGINIEIKNTKNKIAAPFKLANYQLYFMQGHDDRTFILDSAITLDMIQQKGAWYVMPDGKSVQGMGAALSYVDDEFKEEVRSRLGLATKTWLDGDSDVENAGTDEPGRIQQVENKQE